MVSILMRSHLFLQYLRLLASLSLVFTSQAISIQEASISDLQLAFKQNNLTSRQLTKFYLCKIRRLNPVVRAIIEVNPDGLKHAKRADRESKAKKHDLLSILRGIPILLKDNIGTKDKQNTMAGSFALLGSAVARDAGVVARLRQAGAVILGKANMNEWAGFRSFDSTKWLECKGWTRQDPCGLTSGSAISVVANMVAVSLGTETNGSILCPASLYSAVGIKPTVGLTSRAGVIPITPRQDTIGYVIKWMLPEYTCYWRAVNPDTTAALAFGLMAAQRHGTDVTLWRGPQGRGDPYRTLLREGTTALLSSYKSIQFPYQMIQDMNYRPGWARHRTSSSRRYASGGPTLGK